MHPSDPNQAEITRLLEVLGASERWLMEGLVGNGWDISRQGKVEHLTGPEGELVVKWLGQEIEWRKWAGKRRQLGDRGEGLGDERTGQTGTGDGSPGGSGGLAGDLDAGDRGCGAAGWAGAGGGRVK